MSKIIYELSWETLEPSTSLQMPGFRLTVIVQEGLRLYTPLLRYLTRGHFTTYYSVARLLFDLTSTASTPPLPYIDGFRSTLGARQIVVNSLFGHGDICWTVQGNEREVGQIDLVDLVEDLLTGILVTT